MSLRDAASAASATGLVRPNPPPAHEYSEHTNGYVRHAASRRLQLPPPPPTPPPPSHPLHLQQLRRARHAGQNKSTPSQSADRGSDPSSGFAPSFTARPLQPLQSYSQRHNPRQTRREDKTKLTMSSVRLLARPQNTDSHQPNLVLSLPLPPPPPPSTATVAATAAPSSIHLVSTVAASHNAIATPTRQSTGISVIHRRKTSSSSPHSLDRTWPSQTSKTPYTFQHAGTTADAHGSSLTRPSASIRIIDRCYKFAGTELRKLLFESQQTASVVGAIGRKSVGKSTILSALEPLHPAPLPFRSRSPGDTMDRHFSIRAYVGRLRQILIDAQFAAPKKQSPQNCGYKGPQKIVFQRRQYQPPPLSQSQSQPQNKQDTRARNRQGSSSSSTSSQQQYDSANNTSKLATQVFPILFAATEESLAKDSINVQICAWLLSTVDVLLVVLGDAVDNDILQCLGIAYELLSKTPGLICSCSIVFVINKTKPFETSPQKLESINDAISQHPALARLLAAERVLPPKIMAGQSQQGKYHPASVGVPAGVWKSTKPPVSSDAPLPTQQAFGGLLRPGSANQPGNHTASTVDTAIGKTISTPPPVLGDKVPTATPEIANTLSSVVGPKAMFLPTQHHHYQNGGCGANGCENTYRPFYTIFLPDFSCDQKDYQVPYSMSVERLRSLVFGIRRRKVVCETEWLRLAAQSWDFVSRAGYLLDNND